MPTTSEPSIAVPDDDALRALAQRLGEALIARHLTLVTAESCTGGWIAKAITDLAGSSQWFAGAIVAYGNTLKQALLGVPAQTLAAHGAVSGETAMAMVAGALAATDADLAVAVTGIAGPGGGTDAKPVGTVWIAWQVRGRPALAKSFHFHGDREAVRRQTVAAGLREMQAMIDAP